MEMNCSTQSAPGFSPGASAPARSLEGFTVFYAPTPQAFDLKIQHLPSGDCVFVIVDTLRAATTWVAIVAAGAKALQIVVKDYEKMASADDLQTGDQQWLIGGEKDGKPLPGGVVGNSPIEVTTEKMTNASVRFASTNGARAVRAAARRSDDIYLTCLANIDATCDVLAAKGFDRIVFLAGGFYGAATLEDTVTVGRILQQLIKRGAVTPGDLDDEALMAFAASDAYMDDHKLVATLKGAQVGRLLAHVGHANDVEAVVTGKGMDPSIWQEMQNTVLKFDANDGVFSRARIAEAKLHEPINQLRTGETLYVGSL